MGILPDYVVQRSVDFKNWVTVLRWQGGFGLPVSQAKLSTISFGQSRMAFYRIKEHVNLPAANLRQFCLANANLSEADFSGANMMGIDLSRACLRGANLQQTQMNQANLSGADLCQADLFGATVQGANLNGAILLNTRMPDGGIETDNADAEQLALEISGQLLAPVDLYVQIRADLAAVRTAFPAVASVRCFPRWGIGQVIVNSPEDRIERLKDGDLGGFTVERISPSSSFNLLKFERHYHPKVLSSLLWAEYRIWGEPNYVYGDGGRITWDPTTGQYTFSVAWGDCLAGCTCGHFWTFLVSADKQVVLIEEFGSPLPPVP